MSIDKTTLKRILLSNQEEIERYTVIPRRLPSDDFTRRVFVGVRRAGKSYMLFQKIQERLSVGYTWDDMLFLSFEDERLEQFTAQDFDLILQSHRELSDHRPMLFLDEIQNIEGWEKFARRLADSKYDVWLTGSNAKMLSSEIVTTLGGRYLPEEVYPYNFKEYLNAMKVQYDEKSQLRPTSLAQIMRQWHEYLLWGGLPESVGLSVKRDYLTSTFQKIYLGDIINRNKIEKDGALRLLLKKIAETVMRPVSYSKLAHILSSIGGKVSIPTVKSFISYAEDACLIYRLRNIQASFAEKETSCKYYFVDNGILNLALLDGESALLENIVALALFRKYGYDKDNERIFFYSDKREIDFYIPEDQLAIQVSMTLKKDQSAYDREVQALSLLPNVHLCRTRLILTYDESEEIEDKHGTIHVMPVWRWLLEM